MSVANINVRNLPAEVHAALRVQAAEAGRSMEAEARRILCEGVRPRRESGREAAKRLIALTDRLYGGNLPTGVVEELIAERRLAAGEE